MGAIITHHGPTTKHKNLSIVYSKNRSIYKSEIVQLREIIKEKSQFPSIEKIVFILFGPPNFPLVRACEYISTKVNLPIFQGFNQEDKVQILQLRQEIETTEAYSNGLIVLNLALYCEDIEILKRYLDSKNMKLCLLFFEIDGEVSFLSSLHLLISHSRP